MPTVKLYDPYRLVDPTLPMPAPVESRTASGKFNGFVTPMEQEHYPIDSNFWARQGRGAWQMLSDRMAGNAWFGLPDMILPPEVCTADLFSWRTITEMVWAAAEQAEKTPNDQRAVAGAAHKYLAELQFQVALKHMASSGSVNLQAFANDFGITEWDNLQEVEYE